MNAKNSTSFNRDPSKASEFVRGNSSNVPFAPGGIPVVEVEPVEYLKELDLKNMSSIAPGLTRGLIFDGTESTVPSVDMAHLFSGGDDALLETFMEDEVKENDEISAVDQTVETKDVDEFLPETVSWKA